jgi:hypothetical protein
MKRLFSILFAVVCLTAFANNAMACACCVDEGFYSISTEKPREYVLGILDSMEFAPKAEIYIGAADYETLKGLEIVSQEYESGVWSSGGNAFNLVNEFTNKTWKLTFKTPGGKTGTLTMPMPTQMVQFKVDTHDTKDNGLGVTLYKEMRFKGYVQSGTGIFRAGIVKPTSYFLVFQGHGNGCDDVSNYTHWHLEIDGKKAKYEFNGKLKSGAAEETTETKSAESEK